MNVMPPIVFFRPRGLTKINHMGEIEVA